MTNNGEEKQARTDLRRISGTVASVSGDKTISVVVDNLSKHPLYGKYIRRSSKLAVHDPNNEAQVGDTVEITPCRPLSKRKSWRMTRVMVRPSVVTK